MFDRQASLREIKGQRPDFRNFGKPCADGCLFLAAVHVRYPKNGARAVGACGGLERRGRISFHHVPIRVCRIAHPEVGTESSGVAPLGGLLTGFGCLSEDLPATVGCDHRNHQAEHEVRQV